MHLGEGVVSGKEREGLFCPQRTQRYSTFRRFLGLLLPDGGRPSKESWRLFPVLGLVLLERSCRSDIVIVLGAMSGERLSHRPAQALYTEQFVQASFQKCLAAPWITINET